MLSWCKEKRGGNRKTIRRVFLIQKPSTDIHWLSSKISKFNPLFIIHPFGVAQNFRDSYLWKKAGDRCDPTRRIAENIFRLQEEQKARACTNVLHKRHSRCRCREHHAAHSPYRRREEEMLRSKIERSAWKKTHEQHSRTILFRIFCSEECCVFWWNAIKRCSGSIHRFRCSEECGAIIQIEECRCCLPVCFQLSRSCEAHALHRGFGQSIGPCKWLTDAIIDCINQHASGAILRWRIEPNEELGIAECDGGIDQIRCNAET